MSSQYQALNVHESKIQGLDCHSRTKSNISRSVVVHICMTGNKYSQILEVLTQNNNSLNIWI